MVQVIQRVGEAHLIGNREGRVSRAKDGGWQRTKDVKR